MNISREIGKFATIFVHVSYMQIVLQLLTIIGSITLFLYGLSLLSGGLQKVTGEKLKSSFASMTNNPFQRVATGFAATAVIQSSRSTTIMIVSLVNAGILTLSQAIGVIMGANMGTTLSSWVIAVFGFSLNISVVIFAIFAIGFILYQNKKRPRLKDLGELIIGFSLFFIGFAILRDTGSALLDSIDTSGLESFLNIMAGPINLSIVIFMVLGALLTICCKSSAVSMSVIMILASIGIINFDIAAGMVIGENMGATVAANFAASVGNTTSKRAALAHTLFNAFGLVWAICLFRPFLSLSGAIVSSVLGLPNPNDIALATATGSGEPALSMVYGVTMIYTLFNLINALVLVWFIPKIEELVSVLIPTKAAEESYHLQYISGGHLSTAELSMDEVQHEIINFANICHKGFSYVRDAVNAGNGDVFAEFKAKLDRYEVISDNMESEISAFLSEVSKNEVSEATSKKIKKAYKIIGEMESLGDSGEAIGRAIQRAYDINKKFDKDILERLNKMIDLVDDAYKAMIENLSVPQKELGNIDNAVDAEARIDNYRNELREEHMKNLGDNPEYDHQLGMVFMDITSELEKIGDFIINISEVQLGKKEF